MARHLSAEKQARKAVKQHERNKAYLSRMRTAIKKVRLAKDKDKAEAALREVYKLLDQLASKKIIHKNKAAQQKSKLTKFVSAIK